MPHEERLEGQVPLKYAKTLMRFVVEYGYDPEKFVKQAGLESSVLKNKEEHAYVSVKQYSNLCSQIMNLLHDESFGLKAGQGVTPGAFKMMCYALIHCSNLRDALNRACDFFKIFYTELLHLELNVERDVASLGYRRSGELYQGSSLLKDASGLCAWHRFCSWLISETVNLQGVSFAFDAPADKTQKRYRELFNAPVSYEREGSQIVFDAKFLKYPILQSEKTLKEFLASAPHYLLVMPSKDVGRGNLVAKVRSLIGHDFSQGFPSFEEISSALHMSGPTLRRHLKKEGVTFQELKDESRREVAVAYLSRPELSINTIAALMGFTEPSAFHRSFKKWTGKPPGQFRSELAISDEEDILEEE